jgi:hypothetical protein
VQAGQPGRVRGLRRPRGLKKEGLYKAAGQRIIGGMSTKQDEAQADAATEKSNEFLAPVIEGTREFFGSQTTLTELLSRRIGAPVSRHSVNRWLHDDPAKRQVPYLGVGLLLREVFNANKKTICRPWDSAKRRKRRTKKAA